MQYEFREPSTTVALLGVSLYVGGMGTGRECNLFCSVRKPAAR